MKIICNGEEREIAANTAVAELIADLGLKAANLVIEYNGRILKPEEYAGQRLAEGDSLELIRFVGGG